MHNLFSLYKCVGSLPFYAKKSSWSKAYVKVEKLDFKKKLAFGKVYHMKKLDNNLISGSRTNDWQLKEISIEK